MKHYLIGFLDPFVSLLEIQKLMYFLQEAGEPLKLRYTKAPYGPYSENLRPVLKAIAFLSDHPDTEARFKRVCDLVSGFESPFGLELLATVHWLHTREQPSGLDHLVQQTYEWNPGKRQFSPRQIQLANHVLAQQGWVKPLT